MPPNCFCARAYTGVEVLDELWHSVPFTNRSCAAQRKFKLLAGWNGDHNYRGPASVPLFPVCDRVTTFCRRRVNWG